MTIKGKPKNLDDFLSGSAEQAGAPGARRAQRITKTIRISPDIEVALKDAAYTRSKASGQRVTESDLIDEALKKYLNE
ncbi:MAG: hypothetical protein PHE55_12445 [Methylococcaceae bacterium]|nr:hypothetical protein [Methylococcaceae bacterium]